MIPQVNSSDGPGALTLRRAQGERRVASANRLPNLCTGVLTLHGAGGFGKSPTGADLKRLRKLGAKAIPASSIAAIASATARLGIAALADLRNGNPKHVDPHHTGAVHEAAVGNLTGSLGRCARADRHGRVKQRAVAPGTNQLRGVPRHGDKRGNRSTLARCQRGPDTPLSLGEISALDAIRTCDPRISYPVKEGTFRHSFFRSRHLPNPAAARLPVPEGFKRTSWHLG